MNRPSTRTAFTIVELLVTISVVGVLSAIAVAALGSGRKAADRTAEVAAARQLATGYALGAQDNGGKFLPAKPSQEAVPFMEVKDLNGNNILHGAAIERITFRLLPYVGNPGAVALAKKQSYRHK